MMATMSAVAITIMEDQAITRVRHTAATMAAALASGSVLEAAVGNN